MVDPDRMLKLANSNIKNRIHLITGGGHDIANTHTKQLVDIINEYVK